MVKKDTLYIIDRKGDWSEKLKANISEREYELISSKSMENAMDMFYQYNTQIDCVILAESSLNMEFAEMISDIRNYSEIPVLILSDNMEYELQMVFYKAGADDFLPYDYPLELLKMKIQLLSKKIYGKNDILQEGIMEVDTFHKKIKVNDINIPITVKEFELLYYLIRHKKVIQTRDQILTAVWGINYMGNDRVVDSLVKKIRNKIGDAASYIKTVYAMGYYFEAPENEK